MKKLSLPILMLLVFSCNYVGQTDNLIYDKLERPDNVEYYHMPIGLCEDWPEESTTREIYVNDFELLKRTNIDLLRISFGWDAIESEKDKYDWLFWDDFVKTGVEEYNITMVPYVCYTPTWLSTDPPTAFYYWNKPATDFEEFGEFMFDLVTRYKKWIKTWELWNEPDISIYWSTEDAAEFARFTKIGAEAVKRADPEAKVVLGGIAYKPEWIQELFEQHGLSSFIDIVNCHNYFETWHHNPVEEITNYVNDVYEVVHKYGDGQPIWMAEVGYSTFRTKEGKVSDSYSCYYDYEHTPAYQAVDLIKRIALVRSTEQIDALAWYEIKDLPQGDEVIGDIYNNKHLGLAWNDHSPKPANHALKFINQLFKMPMKSINDKVKVVYENGSDARLVSLKRENGDVILISWLQTSIPEKQEAENPGQIKDERVETITIELPYELEGETILYNELGKGESYNKVAGSEGKTVVEGLELKGGEIAILEIKK